MPTTVKILKPEHAGEYRTLMLEAYAEAPDAFTSTPEERAAEPESWWVKRIADSSGLSAAFGAYIEGSLVGTAALEFSAKPKTRHKALLIGMYVRPLSLTVSIKSWHYTRLFILHMRNDGCERTV
jgi:hypothetical protein